ncbi:MAG: capsular polysaccharide synthesis protein [Bacteroidales bacterium]|nr:capsular polysaccharide synthesis protein [Bacteroidales bacterium]
MTTISRLRRRFRQFGGLRLVATYIRFGVFGEFLKQGLRALAGRCSINEAYSRIERKAIPKLQKQYLGLLDQLAAKYENQKLEHKKNDVIWVCWLQGMEQAPEIVKICNESLNRYIKGKEIIVITEENIGDYVTFPEHIQRKYKQGKIPMAQYSDMLRLELLIKHGGTWIDSTVLCTGDHFQKEVLDSDLFFFQFLKEGTEKPTGISNWFITASSNQRVLLILRDMLYKYWEDYDCLVAYFIFHVFFTMIARKLPGELAAMPKISNKYCFYLEHRLADEYDEQWLKELTDRCCFHKLNSRLWKEAERKENTFLCKIKSWYL